MGVRKKDAALPYDYVCQYHTFDGHSVVVTDSIPDSTKKWRVVYYGSAISGMANSEVNVIGLYDNTTGTTNRVYIGPYQSALRGMLIANEYNITSGGAYQNSLVDETVDIPNRLHSATKNGGTIQSKAIGNFGTFVTQKPVALGARISYTNSLPSYGELAVGIVGKIYSFEEWTSGTKTADWIPVVVGTEACYYDQITGTIYHANLTLGNALTAGPQA